MMPHEAWHFFNIAKNLGKMTIKLYGIAYNPTQNIGYAENIGFGIPLFHEIFESAG
jgi:hypothetical protein